MSRDIIMNHCFSYKASKSLGLDVHEEMGVPTWLCGWISPYKNLCLSFKDLWRCLVRYLWGIFWCDVDLSFRQTLWGIQTYTICQVDDKSSQVSCRPTPKFGGCVFGAMMFTKTKRSGDRPRSFPGGISTFTCLRNPFPGFSRSNDPFSCEKFKQWHYCWFWRPFQAPSTKNGLGIPSYIFTFIY